MRNTFRNNELSKDEIYASICRASKFNTLGFFVGKGMPAEIFETDGGFEPISMQSLLEECCKRLSIDKRIIQGVSSYPEAAGTVISAYARANNVSKGFAAIRFKNAFASVSEMMPEQNSLREYGRYFEKLNIDWIVTANYDTIMETLLCGKSVSLDPTDNFIKVNDIVPVYHLYGSYANPENIILSSEDFASMIRPSDYAQNRLPFLFKESTVLILGYAVNDPGVLCMMNLKNCAYTGNSSYYNLPVIQLVITANPPHRPYRTDDGRIIVEVKSAASFFKELGEYDVKIGKTYLAIAEEVKKSSCKFRAADGNDVNKFIDDKDYRRAVINKVGGLSPEYYYIYSSYRNFLSDVMCETFKRGIADSLITHKIKLEILLDLLSGIKNPAVPVSHYKFMASVFADIAYAIGNDTDQGLGLAWLHGIASLPREVIVNLRKQCVLCSHPDAAYAVMLLQE